VASKRTFFLPATTGAALALLVTACGDDVTDPGALLASAEAEAIVRSAAALPSLGTLIEVFEPAGDADRATLLQAHELWTAGTAADDERGRAQRRVAVRHASPILARTVPGEEWVEVRERLDRWIGTADLMLEHLRLPEVDDRIAAARRYLQRADAATVAEGRPHFLLLAAAELVETTPAFVARRLAADADAALARTDRAPSVLEEPGLERARRLKDWAVRAVDEEDYLLAIQRAYYALQLVNEREAQ